MIVTQILKSITKSTPIFSSLFHKLPTYTHTPLYKFSTQSPQQILLKLTSQQTLKQFQQYLNQNTKQSLQKGAQLLASLQVIVQQNQQEIKQLQSKLQTCSSSTKHLIEKIHIVIQNIKHQENQIESIQRRAQKEIVDCKNFSISSIAKEILQVADAITRSKKTSLDHHKSQDHQVVQAIQNADKQIKSIFQRYGIVQFDPIGEEYDPNKQEALATLPTQNEKKKNKVASTMRTGFTIKGRLLRSAHVAVYV